MDTDRPKRLGGRVIAGSVDQKEVILKDEQIAFRTVLAHELMRAVDAFKGYRKILFILKDFSKKRNETLGEYYIRTYSHLIPSDVEIWECDEVQSQAKKIK